LVSGKLFKVFGAMAGEDAEVVKVDGCVDDVVIIGFGGADSPAESIEPWLMPKFFTGLGLVVDVVVEGGAPRSHGFFLAQMSDIVCRCSQTGTPQRGIECCGAQ
jgi:hypothetical protein